MLCAVCTVLILLLSAAGQTANGTVSSPHYMSIGCRTSDEQGVEWERCQGLYTLERTWDEAMARCLSDGWSGLALANTEDVESSLGNFMVWMNEELDADYGYSAWIGGHEVNDRVWKWSDGTTFQRQSDHVYRLIFTYFLYVLFTAAIKLFSIHLLVTLFSLHLNL